MYSHALLLLTNNIMPVAAIQEVSGYKDRGESQTIQLEMAC